MSPFNFGVARTNFRTKQFVTLFDPQLLLWENAIGAGNLTAGRKTLLDTYLGGLRLDGVLTKMDHLNWYAAEGSVQALMDIMRLSNVSPIAAPTFTIDRGYTGTTPAGGSKYLDLLLTPTGSGNYKQDDSHFSFWMRTNKGSVDGVEMGTSTAAGAYGAAISVKWGDGNCYAAINDANLDSGAAGSADTSGHWIVTRSASGSFIIYHNGTSFRTVTGTSTGLPSLSFCVNGGYDSGGGNAWNYGNAAEYSMSSLGGGLDATQALALYNRTFTLMQAVGAA